MNELDAKLTKPQKANLVRILTAIILLSSMSLSAIATGWLGNISVNALSHFMSYSGIVGETLMASAIRFAIRAIGLKGASVRLEIDDTMEHHSRLCTCIASVYNLFDHILGAYCKAKCIVFAYIVVNESIRFKWKDGDMEKAVKSLKIEIEKGKKEYEELGLTIITA